ncbi:MAG: D-2-hydroxyacid dehydrogenase [Pseudomonadales bacterium]|nr:D-2-hydroxyacid dehydrogenase [Pseudomonadales bacterium]
MRGVILDADSLGEDTDLSPLTRLLPDWQIYPFTEPQQTAERVAGAGVVLSNKVRLDEAVLANAGHLQYISVMATGTNNVDLKACQRLGIAVSNAVDYATPSVVQHTVGLLLALATQMNRYLQDVRNGHWQSARVFCLLDHQITELAGKNLGILGYGNLGQKVAGVAAALGMNLLISDRPDHDGPATKGRIPFSEVLAESDFLTLHCPLTANNRHLINARTIAAMKPGACLINTARGGLVDGNALIAALTSGHLAGAAIDVLDTEPPGDAEPLLQALPSLPNLLVTPHNAWAAKESRQRLVGQMAENVEAFLRGETLRSVLP